MSNKLREKFYLERLCELMNLRGVTIRAREAPDLEVVLGRQVFGIEITELNPDHVGSSRGAKLRARENHHSQIVRAANRFYREQDGTPVHVSIALHERGHDLNRKQLAQELAVW